MVVSNRNLLFQGPIFRGDVSFREGNLWMFYVDDVNTVLYICIPICNFHTSVGITYIQSSKLGYKYQPTILPIKKWCCFKWLFIVYRRPLTCNDTGEIRLKFTSLSTKIPWEFPGIHPELVQGVAGPKEQSGNVPGHDLFGDMGRRGVLVSAEWVKDEGMDLRDLGDGCWWLLVECFCWRLPAAEKRFPTVYFCVFVRPIVPCMFFLGEKCHQTTYVSEVLGFCGREHRKKQAVNPQTWADCPTNLALFAIWKHPMNLLPLLKNPGNLPQCVFAVGG